MRDDVTQTDRNGVAARKDMSQKATELRKNGEFESALLLYRELSKDASDPYAAAGLLYCLRKLGHFQEALRLCADPCPAHLSLKWYRIEVTLVLIEGKLKTLDRTARLEEVVRTAESVLALKPEEAWKRWKAVHAVLKIAKHKERWELMLKWTEFVNPDELSAQPIKDNRGRDGWCEQSIWYNARILAMVEVGNREEAIQLAQRAQKMFSRQGKFFARLEALGNFRLQRFAEADVMYGKISSEWQPEWWILWEHGQVLQKLERPQDALKMMCQAAILGNKPEMMVSLFSHIGFLCLELGMQIEARNHLALCVSVRQQQKWGLPESLNARLNDLNDRLGLRDIAIDFSAVLSACRGFWARTTEVERKPSEQPRRKAMRSALKGKLIASPPEKPFCFIAGSNQESFFCSKNDLPIGIAPETFVEFDAIPSFDRKKNRESWRAVNVRPA